MYHADVILHLREVFDKEKKYLADVLSLDPCNSVNTFRNFSSNYFLSKKILRFFLKFGMFEIHKVSRLRDTITRGDTLYHSMIRKYHTDVICP